MRELDCPYCQHKFQVEKWDVVPCPSCGANYDYDDDGYTQWEFSDVAECGSFSRLSISIMNILARMGMLRG